MSPSTKPLKGFRDFFPEDLQIQRYIFDTWRKVCLLYGYEEYDGPVLENIELYVHSGADIGETGKDLYHFVDRGGRTVALRPEMTPTVGRMVADHSNNLVKPIRWFSIAQFFRAENPQRGRGREFYQLNCDIFGSDSILADTESLSLSLEIMKAFGATKDQFSLHISDRRFLSPVLLSITEETEIEKIRPLMRMIDASGKHDSGWFTEGLTEMGLKPDSVQACLDLLTGSLPELLVKYPQNPGLVHIEKLLEILTSQGYGDLVQFNPGITRGFDYYTGVVFEMFDKNPQNNRSMFGGGRYDDLLTIFGKPNLPAVGFAPGDITFQLFLEEWGLMPKFEGTSCQVLVTLFPLNQKDLRQKEFELAQQLRASGVAVEMIIDEIPLAKQLGIANKREIPYVCVIGPEEAQKGLVKIKTMANGEEISLNEKEALGHVLKLVSQT